MEKLKAEFVGEGADLQLVEQYIRAFAAARAMRKAIDAKFGHHDEPFLVALDDKIERMGVHDFNSVIFLDEPDRASTSADTPLSVGIEFKKVKGEWKVLSLASLDKPEDHVKRLKAYIEAVGAITERVKKGDYASADQAVGAANDAESKWCGF